jgi:hypothetical protein
MGLDIWFAEDIRNALLAADEASSATAAVAATFGEPATLRAYREGYKAALTTVALAFGLSPSVITGRSSLRGPATSSVQDSGQGEILEVEARTVGYMMRDT